MSYQHILVAVDLSDASKKLVDKAIAQARPTNSQLSIVFVDENHVVKEKEEEKRLTQKLQDLAESCDYPITETLVVLGDLHMKIEGLVEHQDFDLVVCGHHHSLMSRMFSSAPKLVNNVKADLLVVYLDD
ncbi:universal stress protein [Vibrio zhugei]|uniref:Universal stress protein n=1 Tax=Vibrio zhugei TaxID=2479546 RepID=A0ABV7CDX6_9VIBR|nr:universal stress protein [Vibrio zhugei]